MSSINNNQSTNQQSNNTPIGAGATQTNQSSIIRPLSQSELDDMFNENKRKEKEQELRKFMKLVMGKRQEDIYKIAYCRFTDNRSEPQLQPISGEEIAYYLDDIFEIIASKKTKLNGKVNNWNNGCFGSRWLDWYSKDRKTFCRVAFHTKSQTKGEWKWEQEYLLNLSFEKYRKGTW